MKRRFLAVGVTGAAVAAATIVLLGNTSPAGSDSSYRQSTLTTVEERPGMNVRLDPPGPATAKLSASEAVAAFRSSPFAAKESGDDTVVRLVRYTNRVMRDVTGELLFTNRLAWEIANSGIASSRGGAMNGSVRPVSECTFRYYADASTGEYVTADLVCEGTRIEKK